MKMLKWTALGVMVLLSMQISSAFEDYDDSKNYCGPASGPSVPRSPSDADFNHACYNHDKCYNQCENTKHTQAYCDLQFLENMVKSCGDYYDEHYKPDCEDTTNFLWLQDMCWNTANDFYRDCTTYAATYYTAVATLGKAVGSFNCDDSSGTEYNTEAKVTKRYNQIMDSGKSGIERQGEVTPCMSMRLPAILALISATLVKAVKII